MIFAVIIELHHNQSMLATIMSFLLQKCLKIFRCCSKDFQPIVKWPFQSIEGDKCYKDFSNSLVTYLFSH